MQALLLSIHHRLLPQRKNLGYMPYVWLAYLGIYYFNFWFVPLGSNNEFKLILAHITVPLFLFMYFRAYWVNPRLLLFYIFAIWALGAIQTHINPGASVFMVYAAAFCSGLGKPRLGFVVIGMIVMLIVIQSWLMSLPVFFYAPAIFFVMLIGGSNIYFYEINAKNAQLKLSEMQIKKLAETAERERIARDLHDLIGHTFSMITMKAQLAKKLFEHDLERAQQEVAELESISREALAQVRDAVTGYRRKDLNSEIDQARALLAAADIECETRVELDNLDEEISAALGLALRELVNNVVKHANASRCEIVVLQDSVNIQVDVNDDGSAEEVVEGNGLAGIRERIEALQGKVKVSADKGLAVSLEVPCG